MSGISKSISQKPKNEGPNKFSNYPTPIKEQDESKYSNQKKKDTPTVDDSEDDDDSDSESSSDVSSATASKSAGNFIGGDKAAQMKYLLEKYTGKNK